MVTFPVGVATTKNDDIGVPEGEKQASRAYRHGAGPDGTKAGAGEGGGGEGRKDATRKIFHTTFGLVKEQEQRKNGQGRDDRVAIQKR